MTLYSKLHRYILKMVTRRPHNIWQDTNDFVERLLNATSGEGFTYPDKWSALLIVSLNQSNKRLNSVAWLLKNQDWDSGAILTRSMFELSANITYISKAVDRRLPKYLDNGIIPTTAEEIQQLQREFDSGIISNILDMIPKRPWKSMKDICADLKSGWPQEYDSFYRYASVPTHSGAFTLGNSFIQLLSGNPLADHELSTVLITAASFHIRVAKVAAGEFPAQISLEEIKEFDIECNKIGRELISKK